MASIAAQVTRLRGLTFERSVPVTFLAPGRFARAVASGDQPRSASDRTDALRYEEEMRSLGLVAGNVDLVSAQSGADSSDTTGQYDSRTSSIEIRGRELGVEQKVTLAHELTHALQDQHFDLHALEDRTSTSGQDAALTALVEGDAARIEDAYVSGLSAGDQGAYFRMSGGATPGGQPGSGADPEIVDVTSSAPYVLGADMVEAIAATGGNAAVDAAFRSPPRAELDFLQPVAYLRHQRVVPVATPRLDPGACQDGAPDDFGAFSLYLTLSSRIDPRTALAAADGWGGDSQAQYLVGGRWCTRVDLAGRDAAATAAIATALGEWQADMPPGQATVTGEAGRVELTACDPGRTAPAGSRSLNDALDLADHRDGSPPERPPRARDAKGSG